MRALTTATATGPLDAQTSRVCKNTKTLLPAQYIHVLFVAIWTLIWCFRSIFTENPSCDHSARLWQDWQEWRHWEDLGGKQGNRGRPQTLVRHAGQPPSSHRPVASTAARGGGRRCRRSPECQEVNSHQNTESPPPHTYPCISHYYPKVPCISVYSKRAPQLYICSFHPPPLLSFCHLLKRSIDTIQHDGRYSLEKASCSMNSCHWKKKKRRVTGWTDTPLIFFRSIFVLGLWFH